MTPKDDQAVWDWMRGGSTMPPAVIGRVRADVRAVTVEYDYGHGGVRRRRVFPTDRAARRFYSAMSKAGRRPAVVSVRIG